MATLGSFILFLSVTPCFYLLHALLRFLDRVWWTPVRLHATMNSQGISGPPYRYPHGNTREISSMIKQSMDKPMGISHDIFPRIQPHVYAWSKAYGPTFLTWHGSQCQLFVTEPEIIKEILMNREGAFPKMDMEGCAKKLLGESLITNEGEKWGRIRKLANHTFHSESLKRMVPEMSSSVAVMLERWRGFEGKEIDVFKEFGLLTTEVISRTAFGSSYAEGKHIFEMVAQLTALTVRNVYKVKVPGIRMILRADDEVEAENIEQRIKSSILELVKKRADLDGRFGDFGSDFLGQLVKFSQDSDPKLRISMEQMTDEIKTLYGAGHLTTTSLLGWCMLLLSVNTEWQDKAREEVKNVFGGNEPDSDGIARLKIMNMIINECLRLYPPVLTLTRKVTTEVKIGDLHIPSKINIFIPVLALHHNPQIWGKDAHLFRPERFAGGIGKATKHNTAAFLPFGLGPRTCVGLNFTTFEAKITLSMILQKYRFVLSPTYVHCPVDNFVLIPRYGIQVILNTV